MGLVFCAFCWCISYIRLVGFIAMVALGFTLPFIDLFVYLIGLYLLVDCCL